MVSCRSRRSGFAGVMPGPGPAQLSVVRLFTSFLPKQLITNLPNVVSVFASSPQAAVAKGRTSLSACLSLRDTARPKNRFRLRLRSHIIHPRTHDCNKAPHDRNSISSTPPCAWPALAMTTPRIEGGRKSQHPRSGRHGVDPRRVGGLRGLPHHDVDRHVTLPPMLEHRNRSKDLDT